MFGPSPFQNGSLGLFPRLIKSMRLYVHSVHPIRTVNLRSNFGSVFYFHVRFLTAEFEVSSLIFMVGRRSVIAQRPEGKRWTVRLSGRPAGQQALNLLLSSLSFVSPFPSLFHLLQLPASTLQLPFRFVLFSTPPPQRWLQLSSTGSNRHQITINPASLDLPIVILLGG